MSDALLLNMDNGYELDDSEESDEQVEGSEISDGEENSENEDNEAKGNHDESSNKYNIIKDHLNSHFYAQSPIDDLESFFHVTIWAALFNIHNMPHKEWRRLITSSSGRHMAKRDILSFRPLLARHNPIMTQARPILYDWSSRLQKLRDKYGMMTKQVSQFEGSPAEMVTIIEWHWHVIAVNGVCDFLEILKQHEERLRNAPVFSKKSVGSHRK